MESYSVWIWVSVWKVESGSQVIGTNRSERASERGFPSCVSGPLEMRWRQPDKYPLARWLSRRPGSQPLVVIIAKSEIPLAGILGRPPPQRRRRRCLRASAETPLSHANNASQHSHLRTISFFSLAFRTHTL